MSRPIVVPLDGSPFAETVLPKAVYTARTLGAPIDLVFVAVPTLPVVAADPSGMVFATPDAPADSATEYLDAVAQRLRSVPGLVVTCHTPEGGAAAEIARHAEAVDARLIVLSTHGRGGVSRLVLGSVADRLAREASCPLLLLRPGHHGPAGEAVGTRHLLVPLDGSPVGETIIDTALAILGGTPPELTLLHVVPLPTAIPVFPDEALLEPHLDDDVRAMTSYLEAVAERHRARDVTVRVEVRIAERVAPTILAVAAERRADCIAMTTVGRSGVPRWLFGSVADKVVRLAEGEIILWNPPRSARSA